MHGRLRVLCGMALVAALVPMACGGRAEEAEGSMGVAVGAARDRPSDRGVSVTLEVLSPADVTGPDGKSSVCINETWSGDCDHELSGAPQSVRVPLKGSARVVAPYHFDVAELERRKEAGGGGEIRLLLTSEVPGCDVSEDPPLAMWADMVAFWRSVTLSEGDTLLSWDMTGANAALFDADGCAQSQAPVDLRMNIQLPLLHSNGRPTFTFAQIGTTAGENVHLLPPLTLTNSRPRASALDFVFVIDSTGSMRDDIAAVKAASIELIDALFTDVPEARLAIIDYKDLSQPPYGGTSDYPYRLVQDFSNDRAQVVSAISSLGASGGGDVPESVYSALMAALQRPPDHLGNALSPWRDEARKVILLFGDAPPHEPEPITGYTLQGVKDAAASVELPEMPALMSRSTATSGGGVAIYTLQVDSNPEARIYFEALAAVTGGQAFTAANASQVVPTLRRILGELGEAPVVGNRPPETRWAHASVDLLWPANQQMVAVDILNVMDPDGGPVTVEITRITQDEPVGARGAPGADASGLGTASALLRAERTGNANGRVYYIDFVARDEEGAESVGSVQVCVPHDMGPNAVCADDGQEYDSTRP